MSGYYAQGRLQDAEWMMRACMIINRETPAHAPEFTPETPINKAYTQQAAEFESLIRKIDPEGDIDLAEFPVVAFFDPAERWPLDLIIGAGLVLVIYLFLPNWFGVGQFIAYIAVFAYVAISFLLARRKRSRQLMRMRSLGLAPGQRYPLPLRQLVKFRRRPLAKRAPENVTLH